MSPVPPNVVETERVQGPLTLSETCTSPGALNWPNHPTRRSPGKTGSRRMRMSDGRRVADEAANPWTNSGDATGVMILRGGDCAECGSARSTAPPGYAEVDNGATS